MKPGHLTYNGTAYRLDEAAVADLMTRGVIRPDPMTEGQFELSSDHLIEEVEAGATFEGFQTGDDARGESAVIGRRRLFGVSLQHRDGQGGR
jgi:hypothetical protein